jgi:hypothetical protein
MTITWTCPDCERELDIDVDSSGDIDRDACKCGYVITSDDAIEIQGEAEFQQECYESDERGKDYSK